MVGNNLNKNLKGILAVISLIAAICITYIIDKAFLPKTHLWFINPIIELILTIIFYCLLNGWAKSRGKYNNKSNNS